MTIHHVFANRSNIGDWLSARGIQKLLAPLTVTEHLCDDPFVGETIQALEKLGPQDWVVIGGGGLFMDYFDPFWERFAALSNRFPFVIWGAGFCDLKNEASRASASWIKRVIPQSRLCVVRDQLSYELLTGILGSDKKLHPPVICPSVTAIERLSHSGKGLLHVNNYTTAGEAVYDAMRHESSRFAAETGRIYRETNNRIEGGREDHLREVLRRYELSDFVVSSGLHGCILAAAMGHKILAVSGDRKIEGFMQAAGLSDWVLDLSEMDRFAQKLDALDRQPDVNAFILQALRANQAVADEIKTLIARPAEVR